VTFYNLRKRALLPSMFVFIALFSVSCDQPAKVGDNATANITGAGTPAIDKPKPTQISESNQVVIENFAFGPAQLTVSVGTKVKWINKDAMQHSAMSDDKVFDSGLLKQNQEFSRTFDKPGTYPYHCTPHPNMKAKIIVTN
jgi:amicyanin